MSTVTIDLSDAEDVKLVRVNKKRLNRPFLPMAVNDDGDCLMNRKYEALSTPAIRVLNNLLSQCTGLNRVLFHSTELNQSEELRELEQLDVLVRLSAAQYPRRKGFTTVLINPHLVLTTDDEMYQLWVITQSARTQP
jgi:hypothetical protein